MKTRVMHTIIVRPIIFWLSILTLGLAFGQDKKGFIPPSIDDDDIPVVKTELPIPEAGGDFTVKYFKGITDDIESRIAIKKLGYILRPAMIKVFAEDGNELSVELVKKNWDDVVRSGYTENGEYSTAFRTAMEFGIKISAKKRGIPFVVAISAGIELFPESNLFVDAGSMRQIDGGLEDQGGVNTNNTDDPYLFYMAIIGLLVVLILILALLFFKRKSSGTTALLLLLFTSSVLSAQIVPHEIGQSEVGQFAGNLTNAFANFYGNGNFDKFDLLGSDDADHDPNMDPRGQPNLPSSCYNIARISQSHSSGSNSNNDGISKNQTDASGAGDSIEPNQTEDAKDENTEEAIRKAERKKNRSLQQAADIRNAVIEAHTTTFTNTNQAVSQQYRTELSNARGEADAISRATERYQNALDNATQLLERGRVGAETNYSTSVSEIMTSYAREIGGIQQRNTTESLDGKDSDRETQKDKNRSEDKKQGDRNDGAKGGGDNEGANRNLNNPQDTESSRRSQNTGNSNEENKEGCDCLENAYRDLQHNRYTLEKLLKIAQHTKKVTDFGISFGDNFSGIHAVSGLAWQKERFKIIKSIEKFDKTYDNKYKELMDHLYGSLMKIDACEKKLGYENWYSHSGFIYYEFMKVRYASYK